MKTDQPNLPGVSYSTGRGGLERIVIDTDLVQAEIYLHGAHVTHFHPRHQARPVLWMSASSLFEPNKPIRGGVPICFPWFGPKADDSNAPAHGVARLARWSLDRIERSPDGSIIAALELRANEFTRARAPGEFAVRHEITVGRTLQMKLIVMNPGPSPFRFEEALHSYFTVGDVRDISIHGLEGATYLDRLQPGRRFVQDQEPIRFTAETDRSYLNTTTTCTINDPNLGRRITVEKAGSQATVVWNPWVTKSKAMPDFGDDEWPGMVCVETANAGENATLLAAGGEHVMTARIAAAS